MFIAGVRKVTLIWAVGLAAVLAVLAACGGGGDDDEGQSTQQVCLNCGGLSGNARLNCEIQNANRSGC